MLAIIASRIHVSILFYFIATSYYDSFNLTNNYLLLSIVVWHYALYLFDRVFDWKIDSKYQGEESIPQSYVSILFFFIVLLLIASLVLFYKSGFSIWYWGILFPLTFLYTVPIIYNKRIKQFLVLKNLYSAVVIWALPIYLIVYLETKIPITNWALGMKLVVLVLSVLIIEAFWDIRDKQGDLDNNIHTMPNQFGTKYTKYYLITLLFLEFLIIRDLNFFIITMFIFILFVNERSHKIYFHLPIFLLILRGLI